MNAIIFDLDGTLWDVTDSTLKSANEIANKYGLKEVTKETVFKGFGTNREESAKLYFPYLPLKESINVMDEISALNINNLMKNGGKLYPNVVQVLKELKKDYHLFIVSNTSKKTYIDAFLNCSNTKELFDDYIASGSFGLTKPDAIKKIVLDNSCEKAVYIGDTYRDRDAAKLAQVGFIQALYGFGDDLNTTYSINSLNELIELVPKILD